MEPVIRDALTRAATEFEWPDATAVGGWWNRAFDPEIDLIGADRAPVARRLFYAGSIKWLEQPFDSRDLAVLLRDAARVPGFEIGATALVAVSRAGFTDSADGHLAREWGPAGIIAAFS